MIQDVSLKLEFAENAVKSKVIHFLALFSYKNNNC